jgi:hypothetical protein
LFGQGGIDHSGGAVFVTNVKNSRMSWLEFPTCTERGMIYLEDSALEARGWTFTVANSVSWQASMVAAVVGGVMCCVDAVLHSS